MRAISGDQLSFQELFHDCDVNRHAINQFKSYGCSPPFGKIANKSPSYQLHYFLSEGVPSVSITWINVQPANITCEQDTNELVELHVISGKHLSIIKSPWKSSFVSRIIHTLTSPWKSTDEKESEVKQVQAVRLYGAMEMYPKFGYHSKIHLKLEASSSPSPRTIIMHHHSRNSFVDPFEIGRIRYEGQVLSTYGHADLEAPAHTSHAKDNIMISVIDRYILLKAVIVRYQRSSLSI
jgi:hypothetical protein